MSPPLGTIAAVRFWGTGTSSVLFGFLNSAGSSGISYPLSTALNFSILYSAALIL